MRRPVTAVGHRVGRVAWVSEGALPGRLLAHRSAGWSGSRGSASGHSPEIGNNGSCPTGSACWEFIVLPLKATRDVTGNQDHRPLATDRSGIMTPTKVPNL